MGFIARIIYAIGGFIVAMLGLRLLLVLLGANPANDLVSFVYNFTQPFVRPFFGIFNYNPTYGSSTFEMATLIAIVVYGVATGIVGSLLSYNRRSTI